MNQEVLTNISDIINSVGGILQNQTHPNQQSIKNSNQPQLQNINNQFQLTQNASKQPQLTQNINNQNQTLSKLQSQTQNKIEQQNHPQMRDETHTQIKEIKTETPPHIQNNINDKTDINAPTVENIMTEKKTLTSQDPTTQKQFVNQNISTTQKTVPSSPTTDILDNLPINEKQIGEVTTMIENVGKNGSNNIFNNMPLLSKLFA